VTALARDYPPASRSDVVEVHHGEPVADPYRWLEDLDSPETRSFVAAQNALTEEWLAAVESRGEIRSRVEALWDHPRHGVPLDRGGRLFELVNSGLQDQAVLRVTDVDGTDRLLLDPNELSSDGTVALVALAVTDDGGRLAYATSAAGSDWMTWRVRDVSSGADLDDVVEWSKFSTASWAKDGSGFYYGAIERPEPGAELLAESRSLSVRFHRLGEPGPADEVVFAAPHEPAWLPRAEITDDGRYLVVTIERGSFPEAELRVLDLARPDEGFTVLVRGFTAKTVYVTNVGTDFYLLTDDGAERGRIVAVSLDRSDPADFREVVGEGEGTLVDAAFCGGRLVCHYLVDAQSVLRVRGLDGASERDVPLPGIGGVGVLEGTPRSSVVRFSFGSFTESGSIWAHDLASGETLETRPSGFRLDPADYTTERVFARSVDGTAIQMFLSHRRDVVADGDAPVLLYGYGGFDVPVTPFFSVAHAVWMERGGVLAVAVLRGGGEHGRSWHDAGRLAHKQNVFDDFCACARDLCTMGWSRPERIAISGRSNGGLLVGACLTQHPELFGAAVAEVGVFDLLRFHTFTIGWAWTSDYGDPDDPEQYLWVRAYSPVHHVSDGVAYPPVLLTTGDHDDRVVPGHSLKFAATLQAARGGGGPVLLRVDLAAGHGAGKPTGKSVAERADVLAFLDATVGRTLR